MQSNRRVLARGIVSWDLSNCYFSFFLHPSAVEHFAFTFDGNYYALKFTRMPFGLTSAPYICTELLGVVAFTLRQLNIVLVRYLDDFLLISSSEQQASRGSDRGSASVSTLWIGRQPIQDRRSIATDVVPWCTDRYQTRSCSDTKHWDAFP